MASPFQSSVRLLIPRVGSHDDQASETVLLSSSPWAVGSIKASQPPLPVTPREGKLLMAGSTGVQQQAKQQ